MKKITLLIIFCGIINNSFEQNRILDTTAIMNWPEIVEKKITGNGNYIAYVVQNQLGDSRVFIKGLDNSLEMNYACKGTFLRLGDDNRYLFYNTPNDSLGVVDLQNKKIVTIGPMNSTKINNNSGQVWVAYKTKIDKQKLILKNVVENSEIQYDNVVEYYWSKDSKKLWVQTAQNINDYSTYQLFFVDINNGKKNKICSGFRSLQIAEDNSGNRFSFLVQNSKDGPVKLKFYRPGMDDAETILENQPHSLPGMQIAANTSCEFSADGEQIYFQIQKMKDSRLPVSNMAAVDVWNYQDELFPAQQIKRQNRSYKAVVNLNDNNKVVRIENDGENVTSSNVTENHEVVVVSQNSLRRSNPFQYAVKDPEFVDVYLVSTKDGSRRKIIEGIVKRNFELILHRNYLLWFDPESRRWRTYDILTSKWKNIGSMIQRLLSGAGVGNFGPAAGFASYGICGWIDDQNAVLVKDEFDLWVIKLNGEDPPICITNSIGRKREMRFDVIAIEGNALPREKVYRTGDTLLLTAFNNKDKTDEFYCQYLDVAKHGGPQLLTKEGYRYRYHSDSRDAVVKAKNANVYLMVKMKADVFPNIVATRDFKNFTQISDLQPQKKYNWYSNELIDYKLADGRNAHGVLYKPKNFDPHKKYPMIFNYYQRFSGLNLFIFPDFAGGDINIPWFTSRGYLVFKPDIINEVGDIGYPGRCALQYVTSAAIFLSKMPWVDSKRLGLNGHSFGGFETNYIISHSNLFAAAAEAAGMSNMFSSVADSNFNINNQSFYIVGQGSIGKPIWEAPKLYIENSPIFSVVNVHTPLLIMHNKKDPTVSWTQGLEWYVTLNGLGKKVWMLQYDSGGHSVGRNPNDAVDYTIRLTQFFDHYLKGLPAPKWMTTGVPAASKGIDTGYDLHYSSTSK